MKKSHMLDKRRDDDEGEREGGSSAALPGIVEYRTQGIASARARYQRKKKVINANKVKSGLLTLLNFSSFTLSIICLLRHRYEKQKK
jgi:hypothetical protein